VSLQKISDCDAFHIIVTPPEGSSEEWKDANLQLCAHWESELIVVVEDEQRCACCRVIHVCERGSDRFAFVLQRRGRLTNGGRVP